MSTRGRSGGDSALIAALAGGATQEAAAKQAGVSERTVRRRMEEADFRRQVDEARAALLDRAMAQLSRAATGAATTLVLLLGKETPATVRLGAARAILDTALRWREQTTIAERLDRIEAWLDTLDAEAKTEGTPGGWRWRG